MNPYRFRAPIPPPDPWPEQQPRVFRWLLALIAFIFCCQLVYAMVVYP